MNTLIMLYKTKAKIYKAIRKSFQAVRSVARQPTLFGTPRDLKKAQEKLEKLREVLDLRNCETQDNLFIKCQSLFKAVTTFSGKYFIETNEGWLEMWPQLEQELDDVSEQITTDQ